MIINNGPIGENYNLFSPLVNLFISYSSANENFNQIKFYEDESSQEKEYYELRYQNEEDTSKWYLKILKDCWIKIDKNLKCELFLVGGGDGGQSQQAANNSEIAVGGNGGNGGKILIIPNKKIKKQSNIEIKIGNGGSRNGGAGEESFFKNIITNEIISSNSGTYSLGGTGAQSGGESTYVNSNPGNPGIEKYGYKYGGGGGGGGAQGMWWDDHATVKYGSNGGADGGGHGGYYPSTSDEASNGIKNSGGGGGGAHSYVTGNHNYYSASSKNGAAGGSGIIILSNYK